MAEKSTFDMNCKILFYIMYDYITQMNNRGIKNSFTEMHSVMPEVFK